MKDERVGGKEKEDRRMEQGTSISEGKMSPNPVKWRHVISSLMVFVRIGSATNQDGEYLMLQIRSSFSPNGLPFLILFPSHLAGRYMFVWTQLISKAHRSSSYI